MIGVYINVFSENLSIKIQMERRVTYLRGDSGVGKTFLVELLRSHFDDGDTDIEVEIPDGYTLVILNSNDPSLEICNYKNAIFVVDDNIATERKDFGNAINTFLHKNNGYLLIINRVDLGLIGSKDSLDYAVSSILYVSRCEDSIERTVSTVLDRIPVKDINPDYLLGEDVNGITEFLSAYNKSNIAINDSNPKCKDDIMSILSGIPDGLYNCIYLYVDLSTFGRYFGDLLTWSNVISTSLVIDRNYECFEYMILRSNIFKDLWCISNKLNTDYSNWEKGFENILSYLSKSVLFHKYSHKGKCTKCLLVDCKDCNELKYCKSRIRHLCIDNKLIKLFKGTEFDYLIDMLG